MPNDFSIFIPTVSVLRSVRTHYTILTTLTRTDDYRRIDYVVSTAVHYKKCNTAPRKKNVNIRRTRRRTRLV